MTDGIPDKLWMNMIDKNKAHMIDELLTIKDQGKSKWRYEEVFKVVFFTQLNNIWIYQFQLKSCLRLLMFIRLLHLIIPIQ